MKLTAADAQPGDVLLDSNGTAWQRDGTDADWATFNGPVFVYGPWDPSYGPQGDLILLVRDGKPATGCAT